MEVLEGVLEALGGVLEGPDGVLEAMLGQDSAKMPPKSKKVAKAIQNPLFFILKPMDVHANVRSPARGVLPMTPA